MARDRVTRRHMCHVFRCDSPARQIANTLRDICKKIMLEQSLQQQAQVRAHTWRRHFELYLNSCFVIC